jgi:hypothetical protein
MASITKQQFTCICTFGAVLALSSIIIEISLLYDPIKNGNVTEIITNAKESITFTLSTASVIISFVLLFMTNNSLDITENALKLTNTTLELTEIEQQKRDIEKRLELFYYPVSNHFEIKRGKGPKDGLSETDRRDLLHAESFRYLVS